MVSNDDFDGKATHLNCFYLHDNFEQKYPKPAIVISLDITSQRIPLRNDFSFIFLHFYRKFVKKDILKMTQILIQNLKRFKN